MKLVAAAVGDGVAFLWLLRRIVVDVVVVVAAANYCRVDSLH